MSETVRFRGKTSQNIIEVVVDSTDTLILKDHTEIEKDLSNMFEGRTITCDIDFTGIKANTMAGCFKNATLTHQNFKTLVFKDVGDLTHMVTGSNLLHIEFQGHPLYMVQFKDETIYFHKDFYGPYFELTEYLEDVDKDIIDSAILSIRTKDLEEKCASEDTEEHW